MTEFNLIYKRFGENAILIEWPERIENAILHDIIFFQSQLEKYLSHLFLETVIAYNSLTIFYDSNTLSFEVLKIKADKLYTSLTSFKKPRSNLWKVPVCYNTKFGIDLEEMSKAKKIPVNTLIKLHSIPTYTIHFIGFLPGFMYLGGLPEILHFPRKPTPRQKIIQGAVAIGDTQTGIYPVESPGGWNILGNSPLSFFNIKEFPPCVPKAGDQLKFYQICIDEYHDLKNQIENGQFRFQLELKK